jgi:polar amino acid transport system permease protein
LWFLAVVGLIGAAVYGLRSDPNAPDTFTVLWRGIAVTIRVTLFAFAWALVFGLAAALARISSSRLLREGATLYVEVVRGVPLLVLILWIGYGLTPWLLQSARAAAGTLLADGWHVAGLVPAVVEALVPCRRPQACISFESRGILGLAVGYGAYLAEVIRAGIQSVGRGQRDAAAALGLRWWQVLAYVVLPQAMRVALPPLGNDFIALLKDSSLVSVLAVPDLVQQARFQISRTFQAFEVWNLVAILYLVMTLGLSVGVRYLERRTSRESA